jgi:ribosomal protein S4
MVLKKNRRYKPLYKKLILLRKDVLNKKKKTFKFKKQKWKKFNEYLKKRFWVRRKPLSIYDYHVFKFISLGNSFKKKFRNDLRSRKRFNLFYGIRKNIGVKRIVKGIFDNNRKRFDLLLLEVFESRLDSVLYRSHFCHSIRNAQQFISHGCVLVNNKVVKKKSYILKQGDLVQVDPRYSNVVKKSLKKIKKHLKRVYRMKHLIRELWKRFRIRKKDKRRWVWHIPPSYLIIKYKTLQIVFGEVKDFNFSTSFPFRLDVDTILKNYYKR